MSENCVMLGVERGAKAAQPFLPFVVHTADGREYNVPTFT
jgi:hypothetical protein